MKGAVAVGSRPQAAPEVDYSLFTRAIGGSAVMSQINGMNATISNTATPSNYYNAAQVTGSLK